MKDWQIRSLKTFVQAFGSVLIPELCLILSGNLPDSIPSFAKTLAPVLCGALAAGIAAAWNIILEHLKDEPKELEQ